MLYGFLEIFLAEGFLALLYSDSPCIRVAMIGSVVGGENVTVSGGCHLDAVAIGQAVGQGFLESLVASRAFIAFAAFNVDVMTTMQALVAGAATYIAVFVVLDDGLEVVEDGDHFEVDSGSVRRKYSADIQRIFSGYPHPFILFPRPMTDPA